MSSKHVMLTIGIYWMRQLNFLFFFSNINYALSSVTTGTMQNAPLPSWLVLLFAFNVLFVHTKWCLQGYQLPHVSPLCILFVSPWFLMRRKYLISSWFTVHPNKYVDILRSFQNIKANSYGNSHCCCCSIVLFVPERWTFIGVSMLNLICVIIVLA